MLVSGRKGVACCSAMPRHYSSVLTRRGVAGRRGRILSTNSRRLRFMTAIAMWAAKTEALIRALMLGTCRTRNRLTNSSCRNAPNGHRPTGSNPRHADYDTAGQFWEVVACFGLRTSGAGPLHSLLHPRGRRCSTGKRCRCVAFAVAGAKEGFGQDRYGIARSIPVRQQACSNVGSLSEHGGSFKSRTSGRADRRPNKCRRRPCRWQFRP
jgi:hypothetical protein